MSRTRKHKQALAGEHDLPPPPRRPSADECCKSDCAPCIFELYEEELERWERRIAALRGHQARDDDASHRH